MLFDCTIIQCSAISHAISKCNKKNYSCVLVMKCYQLRGGTGLLYAYAPLESP